MARKTRLDRLTETVLEEWTGTAEARICECAHGFDLITAVEMLRSLTPEQRAKMVVLLRAKFKKDDAVTVTNGAFAGVDGTVTEVVLSENGTFVTYTVATPGGPIKLVHEADLVRNVGHTPFVADHRGEIDV